MWPHPKLPPHFIKCGRLKTPKPSPRPIKQGLPRTTFYKMWSEIRGSFCHGQTKTSHPPAITRDIIQLSKIKITRGTFAAERVYRLALKRILHSLFMKCECGASYVDAERAITQPVPTSTPSNAPKNPYNASSIFFQFIKTSFRVFKSTHHPANPQAQSRGTS